MKSPSFVLSLLLVSHVLAEKEPAQLTKLRQTWEHSHAEAQKTADDIYRSKTMNANRLYHAKLEQMKNNFMEAKNPDGANAVDTEIKKLTALHGKQKFTPSKKDGKKTDYARFNVKGILAGDPKLIQIANQQVVFRWCPPTGEEGFMMGSPTTETKRSGNEGGNGQHKVVLSKGFWMMETEVTQGLWVAVMKNNPSGFKDGDSYPVGVVSWGDCQDFIRKVNASGKLPAGVKAALPTEAQWEYACRAGSKTAFHYGDMLSSRLANFNGNHPYGGVPEGGYKKSTVQVKSYAPNAWGLYDMHGNVWEWCADWYNGDYYDTEAAGRNPTGAKEGQYRVLRGGSWDDHGSCCRSANRGGYGPSVRCSDGGFRLSLQVDIADP